VRQPLRILIGLICLAGTPSSLAADAPETDACLARCTQDYDACWRRNATYDGYGDCYVRANACGEACRRRRKSQATPQ
jgi:hypothetical protein